MGLYLYTYICCIRQHKIHNLRYCPFIQTFGREILCYHKSKNNSKAPKVWQRRNPSQRESWQKWWPRECCQYYESWIISGADWRIKGTRERKQNHEAEEEEASAPTNSHRRRTGAISRFISWFLQSKGHIQNERKQVPRSEAESKERWHHTHDEFRWCDSKEEHLEQSKDASKWNSKDI